MRLTDTEFELEVFRRAAAFQQQEKQRRHHLRRIAAVGGVAACLLLAVSGAWLYHTAGGLRSNDLLETAGADNYADTVQGNAEPVLNEDSVEAAEESSIDMEDMIDMDGMIADGENGISEEAEDEAQLQLSLPENAAENGLFRVDVTNCSGQDVTFSMQDISLEYAGETAAMGRYIGEETAPVTLAPGEQYTLMVDPADFGMTGRYPGEYTVSIWQTEISIILNETEEEVS